MKARQFKGMVALIFGGLGIVCIAKIFPVDAALKDIVRTVWGVILLVTSGFLIGTIED